MTYFSHIRAGLMSTALLLTTALASPALAETLPEISPRQIASDVEVRQNPQTGAREFIAPSFDPFEEDRSMAGTASLRSVSSATTIDGQSLRGGALLDMTFYYNSASNDPYDTRGYEDAAYLSGDFAPVTLRDSRILECNEQVQDVVYYHEDYYRPSLYVNLFRPYRHYRGHRGFDRGYYGYDRGFRRHRGRGFSRGYGSPRRIDRNRSRNRNSRTTSRIIDRAIDEATRENRRNMRREGERRERGNRSERRDRADRAERNARRGGADRVTREDGRSADRNRTRRMERVPTSRDSNRIERRSERRSGQRLTREGRRALPRTGSAAQSRQSRPANTAPRRAAPRPAPAPRAAAPAPRASAPAPRPQRARPARAERAARNAQRIKSSNAPKRVSGGKARSRGARSLKMMNVLPMASSWTRNVVRNVDVQCAREEMLSIHISQERLDAARFDGLTVFVLDRQGQEVPVFVPPNYIEGFRQAVSGRVTPSVSYQEPRQSAPVYQAPSPAIESAPCPAGTAKQSDGTCLQGGTVTYGGYPTR